MHFTLTVYRDDDTTVLFEVGTAPDHPNSFLHPPGEMDLGEVDLLAGKAMIGQVNLRVIDPQTGATQAERWMTARLGIPAGEQGAGHSALNGRRAKFERSDGRLIMDGVAWGVQLSDTAAGFHLQLRDVRERARKLPLFTRTGTASVLPRGVINGYGKLPTGGWLIPPTKPLRADVTPAGLVGTTLDFLAHHWTQKSKKWWTVPELALTDAIRSAVQPEVTQGPDFGFGVGPSVRCPLVTVLWRYVGESAWQELRSPIPASSVVGGSPLLSVQTAHLPATAGREEMIVEAVRGIRLTAILQAPLPVSGMGPVEVILRYDGPPSEAYPYHFEGPAGELIRNACRGDYGSGPTKLRYDEAEVLKLTTPARVRLLKPVEDARPWLEQAHQQLGAAPALDSLGQISPVLSALPPAGVVLPTITEANAKAIPGWEHPADRAVTAVAVKYQRDYLVRAIDDPLGERSAGDGIASIDVTVEHAAPQWARDLMGDHPLEIDGWLLRAIGGADGDPVTGDVIDETGAQVAAQRAREVIDRWLFGGQTSFVRVMESDFPGIREGSWVIDARPWRPNYREGKRGGQTLAQVVSVRAAVPGWLDLRLIDAGPADQPLNLPAIGPLALTDSGGVRIPVTTVPTGAEVAVYYAIATSEPAEGSGLWTWAGRVSAPGNVETPPVPAGARVWAYARSEAPGRRPSGRTARRNITLPATPGIYGVRAGIDSEGAATVQWEGNPHTAGVRLYYAVYDVGDPEPTLTTFIDRQASALSAVLPVTVGATQILAVAVEPWSGWTGSAVSGTAGARVPVSVASNRPPPVEIPPIPEYAECRARIVWAESDREHYVIEVTSVPSSGQVYLYSLQGATIVSGPGLGPGLGVPAPSGTKWKLRRPAERAADGEAVWRADPPGYVADDDAVVVPAIGRDTVPLTMRVRQLSKTATTRTVRVSAGDPHYAESSDPITISYVQQGTGGVTPTSGQTIPAAAIRATPDATEAQAGGYVDFVITRPAAGSGDGRVMFTATRPGRVQDVDPVDVAELPPNIPAQSFEPRINTTFVRHVGDQWWELITATDWQGGAAGLEFRYVYYRDGTAHPEWPGFLPLGAGGAEVQVGLDGRWPTHLDIQVKDAAGRIANKSVLLPAHDLTTFYDVEAEVAGGVDFAIDTAAGYTDQQAGAAEESAKLYAEGQASTAYTNAVAVAELDATAKASTARSGAYDDAITTVEGRGLHGDGYDGYVRRGVDRIPAANVESFDGALQKSEGAYLAAITDTELRGLTEDGFVGIVGGAGGLESTALVSQVRETSQNRFGVGAGSEYSHSGVVNTVYDIPQLTTPLEVAGLRPTQVVSVTAMCRNANNGNVQIGIIWLNSVGDWIDITWSADRFVGGDRVRFDLVAMTIPAGTAYIRPAWRRTSGGDAVGYDSHWMLTPGPIPMDFEEPPLRAGRGDEGRGYHSFKQAGILNKAAMDSGNAANVLITTGLTVQARNYETAADRVVFADHGLTFDDPPAVHPGAGGLTAVASGVLSPPYGPVIRFRISASGFEMVARLEQTTSTPSNHSATSWRSGSAGPLYEVNKTDIVAAWDEGYTFVYDLFLPALGSQVTVEFWVHNGFQWALVATRGFANSSGTAVNREGVRDTIYHSGMGRTGYVFGMGYRDEAGVGAPSLTPQRVEWQYVAAPGTASMTPPGAPGVHCLVVGR